MLRFFIYTVIAIILILIIVSTIVRKKTYKEVDRLEEWKNEIASRPIPDEIGKVKQLQMSGQTEVKFEEWRSQWDDIVGTILPDIEERLFDIEDLAVKNRFSKAKQLIAVTNQRLHGIEEQLTFMLDEIDLLVQSEEQNRTEINDVREAYKRLYADLMKKRGLLGQGIVAFDERLDRVNNLLHSFDQATIDGSYLQARETLVESLSILKETDSLLELYPQLLVQFETSIPAEIKELKEGIEEMEDAGYQLEALDLTSRIEMFEETLLLVKDEMTSLNCDEAERRLTELSEQIDQLYDTLENEVESKQYVTDQLLELNSQVEQVNQSIQSLLEETVQIQQSYHIPVEQLKTQEQMKEDVQGLTRQLHVLQDVSLNDKLTFTSIREMIVHWQEDLSELSNSVEDEKKSLYTLREDEWKAKETLRALHDTLLKTNRLVQKSNIPGLPERSLMQLELAEKNLIRASTQLDQVPLELGRVTVLVEEAVSAVDKNEEMIREIIHLAALAENTIQFGNRFRSRSQAVDAGLTEAEQYFRLCEYEEAIECAVRVVKIYEPDMLDRVEEYMKA